MRKHTILFLAANPGETDRLALDREAREIQVELERSCWRDRFELVTRWAAEPLDLLREMRRLAPTVVQFSGHGGDLAADAAHAGQRFARDVVGDSSRPGAAPCPGLFFQGPDGRPRVVSADALRDTFGAAGASVKLVILSACYSEPAADALLTHVDCVVGMAGSIGDHAARSFAVGLYGGLGDRVSIEAAYRGGCAAIGLEGHPDADRLRLKVRPGVNAGQLVLAALRPAEPGNEAAPPQSAAGPTGNGAMGAGGPPRKVFVSHSSLDKPEVKELVDTLRARGIDAWYDDYEIGPGDDIVAKLNEGLASRDAGLVIFSANTDQGRWVSSEISTLFYERVEEGKVLIPVILGDGVRILPLIKPLARVRIEDVDRIVNAIHHRRVKPPLQTPDLVVTSHTVVLTLTRGKTGAIRITITLDGAALASCIHAALPRELVELRDDFLSGFRHAALRSPVAIERRAKEASIAALGRAMAAFCLPDAAVPQIGAVLDRDGQIPGSSIEIVVESEHPDLASLPYESLRLPGSDRLLVDYPAVTMVRRPAQLVWPLAGPLPGPLKILVAVGAPDEGKTANNVLDHERELQNILDAVEPAQRLENVEVRILEASDPVTIGDALKRDQYHVLYITCHGKPGALELDDEEGNAVDATAADLLEALRGAQRPAPLIFLNSCHGAVDKEQTASLAELLLRGGVPAVLAMQTSVSDAYGTALARAFFEELSRSEGVLASRALAHARRTLERQRRDALARGDEAGLTLPEYATPTLFVAGVESPLVDFGLDKTPLQARPVHELDGQVPQLRQDDLIGRRRELRRALWVLRPPRNTEDATRAIDGLRKGPALALVGIGGVGKSTVAGRVMRRLAEDGFLVASHVGTWDLGAVASVVGDVLLESVTAGPALKLRGKDLVDPELDDARRLRLLAKTLADTPVLVVLDDFEQNLSRDGATFLDPDLPRYLTTLLKAAGRGRLLVTSRFPVPGLAGVIATLPIGPLTDADVRKLVLRLPGLHNADTAALCTVLRTIGNHPRVLELVDALVRGGVGRLPHVTLKLNELLARSRTVVPAATSGDLTDALRQSLALGARDVFLDELLAIARERGLAEILLQTAASNLPVHAAGVTHMLADVPVPPGAVEQVAQVLRQLEGMSLVVRMPDGGAWVHRWTAEGLAQLQPEEEKRARWARAGRYRRWRATYESHHLQDLIEAVRNFLRAEAWDDAVADSETVIAVQGRHHQTSGVVSLVAEVLAVLPLQHPMTLWLLGTAGDAYTALGQIDKAHKTYATALAITEQRVAAEPERADYQHDLSVAYEKMGDLYRASGQGDEACKAYAASRAIIERLAAAEPERADYQHDLSASHDRMGNLYRARGQGDEARKAYAAARVIIERLAAAEPERADYQHDLSVAYEKMGDLYRASGQGDEARKAYAASLAIRERLAAAEPERADYQRFLSVSYNKMGDLYRALGQGDEARKAYAASLAIIERLAAAEPERADYQRFLSVSHDRMGDLYRALGQGDEARKAYAASLAIIERLAAAEPERADYQHDLSVSHDQMGDLYRAHGQGGEARKAYAASLAIRERLAAAEPERADYQRSLSVSHDRMGDLYRALGQGDEARKAHAAALATRERLAAAEPERADYQRDLSLAYNKMGDLYRAFGQGDEARKAYAASLAIIERLAAAEPERADYQHDLSVSHERMGDLYRTFGQGDAARKAYAASLAIRERLAAAEPERADYRRELSVSYNKMGDLYIALGQGDAARKPYAAARAIIERLVATEPERADYQRDLSLSYTRLAALAERDGRIEEARAWCERDLEIAEKLAAAEPERADYQVDVAISLMTTARYAGSAARALLERAASILRTLDAEGRLAPADRGKIGAVARILAALQ